MIGNTFYGFECSYEEGYVAFIDMLGFKRFAQMTSSEDIYAYYMSLNGFNQITIENGMTLAVFSDSIIISSNKGSLNEIISACLAVENLIKAMTNLQVRGGIAYGKYYCKNNIAFGPAIIDAYLCEEQTKMIRIGIANSAMANAEENWDYYLDYDGSEVSINKFIFLTSSRLDDPSWILKYAAMTRKEILDLLCEFQGSSIYEKYKWLAKSYNYFCDYIHKYNVDIEKIDL